MDWVTEGSETKNLDPNNISVLIQRFIDAVMHAKECKGCNLNSCMKMKRILHHTRQCRTCPMCKSFLGYCYHHAKTCKDDKCTAPMCANLKKQIKIKENQSAHNQRRLLHRRMNLMRMSTSTQSAPSTSAVVQSPAPSTPSQHKTQPSTPSTKPQPQNSPAPSPHINPASVPPSSVSHSSPGGGKLSGLHSMESVHGPSSVPPFNNPTAQSPRPPGTPGKSTLPRQPPTPVRGMGAGTGREDIVTNRQNPTKILKGYSSENSNVPMATNAVTGQYIQPHQINSSQLHQQPQHPTDTMPPVQQYEQRTQFDPSGRPIQIRVPPNTYSTAAVSHQYHNPQQNYMPRQVQQTHAVLQQRAYQQAGRVGGVPASYRQIPQGHYTGSPMQAQLAAQHVPHRGYPQQGQQHQMAGGVSYQPHPHMPQPQHPSHPPEPAFNSGYPPQQTGFVGQSPADRLTHISDQL